MFYDQRDQGKGADACNSMRMRYYLRKLSDLRCKGLKPEKEVSLMVLMDNCTGQNKSRAVLQFFCMLSTFFQKVVLFYFITGHTKMIADRVVALWRNALKRRNFYSLDDTVAQVATVKTLYPEVVRNNDLDKHCRAGWTPIFDK